jgi:localization factor PodJL
VDAAKRRKLMLIGLVVLAAVPALLLNFNSKPDHPMAPTEAVPEPATPAPVQPAAPAEKQSSLMPSPSDPAPASAVENDSVLTGSIDAPAADSVAEAVSGQAPSDALAMLPAEVGSQKLKLAAASGDTSAQFIVATRFMDGKSVAQDQEQAAYWFGKAAAGGLAPAQYRIATMYERGLGVAKDVKAAQGWYERAAALGNVRSMHNAAVIAANNEAGPADYARAFKWFSLASSHGLKDSQFNLAVLLERGLGTKADPVEAAFWYAAAGQQNDQDAQRRADLLSTTLSASDVAAVQARLKGWKPQVAPKEANTFEMDGAKYGDKQASLAKPAASNEIAVGRVQDMLTQLGYNVGGTNGKLTTRTSNAIKLFQIEQGLIADGRVTPDLIGAMEARLG